MPTYRIRTATRRIVAIRTFAVFALTSPVAGCMLFAHAPANLDYSHTRTSESGVYRATIVTPGDSIPTGKLQSWTLHLETANGVPVDVATVSIDGGMPQHGHGLPTKPQVTRALGDGNHLVEGMKFTMGGWWVVKFRVSSSAGSDSLVFNLNL